MITVTILTLNAAKTLKATLESCKTFDEVLILDNGSTDDTLTIAKAYPNVTIHHSPFIGFGPLHNLAIDLAKNDWIFSLDADETITPDLLKAFPNLDPKSSYEVIRKNFYNGKWIRGCGWYPDKKVRLFNRKTTRFTDHLVHERVITEKTSIVPLKAAIHHTSYTSISDFLKKMEHYSTLYAQEKQKKSSFSKALFASIYTFIKSYILKRGIFDGKEGFIISLYNSQTTFYKYLKTWEKP